MEAPPGPGLGTQDAGPLQHLVSALIDQLAAGQVETLYGLHSAAAGVRQQVESLRTAAAAPAQALATAATGVQDAQAELVTAHTTLTEGRAALQEVVDALRTDLAAQVATQVVAQVQAQVTELVAAQTRMAVQELSAAGERLDATARRSLELVEQAATTAGEELHRASGVAVERLLSSAESVVRASTDTAAAIDEAGRILVDAFAARVTSFFGQLQQDLTRRESRDASREKALYERVQQLAERGEARVQELTERLAHETARLLSRDQEQERVRAEAFVDVLETLLTKIGGRRQLRSRVREAVQAEREAPPLPPAVEAPPVERPEEPARPTPRRAAAKKAGPSERSPARTRGEAKPAPTKKAPAKKATARKKADG